MIGFVLLFLGAVVSLFLTVYIVVFDVHRGMRHNLWKRGVYCQKCGTVITTQRWWWLWLWSLYHSLKCFKFHVDYTSFLLMPKNQKRRKDVND